MQKYRHTKYRHFKGGIYTYQGIVNNGVVTSPDVQTMWARYHEEVNGEVQRHFIERLGDDFYCTSLHSPHVLYQNEAGYLFVRELDDFFGYKEYPNGTKVKRFTLID